MSLGYNVDKGTLDMKLADAVMSVRSALAKVESIAAWLANHPSDGTDPLTQEPFNYTTDEAYVIRVYFESVEALRVGNPSLSGLGRKMTGLE